MKRPVANRVLVEVDLPEQHVSEGGIILATVENAHTKEMAAETGTILAVGPTVFHSWGVEGEFKVGDKVHFKRYAGIVVKPADLGKKIPGQRAMDDEDIILVDDKE